MSKYLDHLRHKTNHSAEELASWPEERTVGLAEHFSFAGLREAVSTLRPPAHGECGYAPLTSVRNLQYPFGEQYKSVWDGDFVSECSNCGWWQVNLIRHRQGSPFDYEQEAETYSGVAKVFINRSLHPLQEITKLLQRDTGDIISVSTTRFEQSIADVFRSYYGATEVHHIGGPDDQGIDVIAVVGNHTHLIQVKRRTNGHPESVKVVRDLIGAYALRLPDIKTTNHSALIMTSAPRFTAPATKVAGAESLSVYPFKIDLYALDQLREIFALASGQIDKPWEYLPLNPAILGRLKNVEPSSNKISRVDVGPRTYSIPWRPTKGFAESGIISVLKMSTDSNSR